MPVYIGSIRKATETVAEGTQAMLNIQKLIFVAEPANVRLSPHTSDATKFVLKSKHPECGAALCQSLGIEPGEQWTGSNYYITAVDKQAFLEAFGKLATAMKVKQLAETPAALTASGVCPECGAEGGQHWGFCLHHMENKGVN
jgi:hypothetical protein